MRNAYVEILLKCPLDCVFCSLGNRKEKGPTGEIEIKKYIDKYAKDGCGKLMITGGEPLLHPRLPEFIRYAKEDAGFQDIAIQTGGTLVTKDIVEKLKDAGLSQLIFSIHSHKPEVVDELMRRKDVLKKQLNGLKNSIEAGLPTFVTTLVLKQNYRHLADFFRFMAKKFPHINHFTINYVDAVGHATENEDVVPKYSESELFLNQAFLMLTKFGKSFRFERVPLCYALEFAENNTELRRIITDEQNEVSRHKNFTSYTKKYFKDEYVRGEACGFCSLKGVCPGIDKHYAKLYGVDEVYPVFVDPQRIIERSGAD